MRDKTWDLIPERNGNRRRCSQSVGSIDLRLKYGRAMGAWAGFKGLSEVEPNAHAGSFRRDALRLL